MSHIILVFTHLVENKFIMASLRIFRTAEADFTSQWQGLRDKLSLAGELLDNRQRLEQVRAILDQVRTGGDKAIAELTAKFDNVTLTPDQFRITLEALKKSHDQMDPDLLAALRQSIANVRAYQQAIKIKPPADWTENGATLGLRYHPIKRVGVCVPGASAPLVSTVIMTVVPAQVAGVENIAVISAPSCNETIHPTILATCYELGVTEVYRVSGAQAVAALAFGTETIPKVDKIVGPSSWWGQLAKKELYGLIDIDSFAGPSEVLILADETARPDWVAADMLSQAEHDPGSAVLLTPSETLAKAVAEEVETQLEQLSRTEGTRRCIDRFSAVIVTKDMDEAVALANDFAAEHLQVLCDDSDGIAERIKNAGAIFIGHYTPVAVGDYHAGPSHVLPTGGSARFFGVLCVNDFLKQSSIISYNADALKQASTAIEKIANAEGLDAHTRSVTIRTDNKEK
jgi:histidinol dehydrogenase